MAANEHSLSSSELLFCRTKRVQNAVPMLRPQLSRVCGWVTTSYNWLPNFHNLEIGRKRRLGKSRSLRADRPAQVRSLLESCGR
jgi:hypothetical protein